MAERPNLEAIDIKTQRNDLWISYQVKNCFDRKASVPHFLFLNLTTIFKTCDLQLRETFDFGMRGGLFIDVLSVGLRAKSTT